MFPAPARSIPFFDYRREFVSEAEELTALFHATGGRGAFILQEDLRRFERNLAGFLDARYAVGVGNCTDGLMLALRAAGIGPGDEVIFCSHTMVASAAAIHFTGATPVPVECGADHLIDPQAAAAAIAPRTRALLPTQLNGRTADMAALGALAARHGLVILEDAAQAVGARFRGRAAGTFGVAGVVSFYPSKLLGCLGDGGAVIAGDDRMCELVRQLRDHGRDVSGEIVRWGMNSRLDNLQAAILDARLPRLATAIERRRAIARLYRARLAGVAELALPPGPDGDPEHFDVFQNYEIEAARRDDLKEFLERRGVGTLIPWGGKAVHQWERLGLRASLPFTEALFRRLLLLPMNPGVSDDDVHAICDLVVEFYE